MYDLNLYQNIQLQKNLLRYSQIQKSAGDIDPQIECITCGCCYGECNLVETNSGYLGPAAINRAFTLIADSRDSAGEERLDLLNSPQGAWGCHTQFNCTDVCPMGDLTHQGNSKT